MSTPTITNNHFSGNANIDFVTQSFVSTAAPTDSAPNNQLYNSSNGALNAGFQPDPLARLALNLTGNVGNNIDITRTGAFYQTTSATLPDQKTVYGEFNGVTNNDTPDIYAFNQGNTPPDVERRRNAQREPGATNTGGVSVDGGAFFLGGVWTNQATLASTTSPNTVNAAPTPSTTNWGPNVSMINNNGDYELAYATFLTGPDAGQTLRVITTTTAAAGTTPQSFTITQALPVAPTPGNQFTVTAPEQAGTGASTFVTDSGPTVNTFNHFNTVITDFTTQVGFLNFNQPSEAQFPFGWRVVPSGSFGVGFP